MKRLLILGFSTALAWPAPSHAGFWRDISFHAFENNCDGQRRDQEQPSHNNDGSRRGFVAEGATVDENAYVHADARVCSGVIVNSPYVHLGADANLKGNVVISDSAYVNSTLRGFVLVTGNSVVDTSNPVVGGRTAGGVTIANSTINGEARVSDHATIVGSTVGGDTEVSGGAQVCNVHSSLRDRKLAHVQHMGGDCLEGRESAAPASQVNYSPYNQRYNNPISTQGYYASCYQWAWDYTRSTWGCASGTGSATQPPYAGVAAQYGSNNGYRVVRAANGLFFAVPQGYDPRQAASVGFSPVGATYHSPAAPAQQPAYGSI